MSNFIIYTQSGSLEPNMFDGLLLWLDVSEQGTLSRDGIRASKMYDKSNNNHVLIAPADINRPQILQSLFDGKSALKFHAPLSKFISIDEFSTSYKITTIGVIDGKVHIDKSDILSITDNKVQVPGSITSSIILSELLVFETQFVNEYDLEWLIDYLTVKWNI